MERGESSSSWLNTPPATPLHSSPKGAESPLLGSPISGNKSPYHKKLAELEEALQSEENSTVNLAKVSAKKIAMPVPQVVLPSKFMAKDDPPSHAPSGAGSSPSSHHSVSPPELHGDLLQVDDHPPSSGRRSSTSQSSGNSSVSPFRETGFTSASRSSSVSSVGATVAPTVSFQAMPAQRPLQAIVPAPLKPSNPSPPLVAPEAGNIDGPRFHNPLRRRSSASLKTPTVLETVGSEAPQVVQQQPQQQQQQLRRHSQQKQQQKPSWFKPVVHSLKEHDEEHDDQEDIEVQMHTNEGNRQYAERGRSAEREEGVRLVTRSHSPGLHRSAVGYDKMTGRRVTEVEDRWSPIHWTNRSVNSRSVSPQRSIPLHIASEADIERYKRSSSYTRIPHLYTQGYFRRSPFRCSTSPVHLRLYALRRTEPARDQISLSPDHTFKPKLVTGSYSRHNPTAGTHRPFYERLYALEHFLEYYRIGAQRKAELELTGCTFKPEILKISHERHEKDPIWQRLYAKRIGEMERRQLRKEALERAELALCTFHPDCTATRKAGKAGDEVSPYERLFEESKGRQERVRMREHQIPHGCTFHPQFTAKNIPLNKKTGIARAQELYSLGTIRVAEERRREQLRNPKPKKKTDEEECSFFPETNWVRRNKSWRPQEMQTNGSNTTAKGVGWSLAKSANAEKPPFLLG